MSLPRNITQRSIPRFSVNCIIIVMISFLFLFWFGLLHFQLVHLKCHILRHGCKRIITNGRNEGHGPNYFEKENKKY